MMGGHHAACGAAVWLALTGPASIVPMTGTLQAPPEYQALGALLCAGAALAPDADHPSATIAHSAGPVSKSAAGIVGAVAGGHRHGTHAPVVAAAVVAGATWVGASGMLDPARFEPLWWVCVGVIVAFAGFAVKALRLVRSWPLAWGVGVGVAAAVALLWPGFLPLLPAVVAVGWCTHLAGDILTTGGLPLAWPLTLPGPRWAPKALWSRGGYVALPVLGDAGSWREWLLCAPISLYALWAFFGAVNGMLPS